MSLYFLSFFFPFFTSFCSWFKKACTNISSIFF